VLREARKYYGCPNLKGMYLENEGGEGTAKSHWEYAAINSDYMIGMGDLEGPF